MNIWQKFWSFLTARKRRDDQWAARFDQPPANRNGKLPLDPGKSDFS